MLKLYTNLILNYFRLLIIICVKFEAVMATPENNKNPSNIEEKKEAKPDLLGKLNASAAPYQAKPKKETASPKKEAGELKPDAKPFVPKSKPAVVSPVPSAPRPTYPPTQYENYPPPDQMYYLPEGYMYAEEEYDKHLEDISDEMDDDPLDSWVKECEDCPCCKGWVYNCSGEACKNMHACYCKVKMGIEESEAKAKQEEEIKSE